MAIPTPQQTIISTGTDPALATYGNALNSAAYVSNGNVTYNITQIEQTVQNTTLTNNFNNTAGGSGGQVQFNVNGVLTGDAGFIYNPNNDTVVVSGNVLTGSISATANITSAGNISANIVNAANLRTDHLQHANGDSYVFTAVTGNITFDEENIISTGNMYLQPNDASASAVDIYLTGSNDVHMATSASGDMLYVGGDNQYVRLNSTGNVDIQSYDSGTDTTNTWNFNNNGQLVFPYGGIIGPDGGESLIVNAKDGVAMYSSNSLVSTGALDLSAVFTNTNNNDLPGVEIWARAKGNATSTWTFSKDGIMAFPNNRINVGAESIDIVSSNYSELLFENSDAANAANGDGITSYIYIEGNQAGTGIETKNGENYYWYNYSDGTAVFPAGISIENNYKQYFNVIVNTNTGSGINLRININVTAAGEMIIVGIANGGSGYVVGDSVFVLGTAINGTNLLNDVYMTVAAVNGSGTITSTGGLTIDTTYTHPLDGVKFAGGGVVSGTDANGNVTIQTFDSEGPTSYNYAFTNQGTLEAYDNFYIKSPSFVDMLWYNDNVVGSKKVGDSDTTGFHAQDNTATIYGSLYNAGSTEWNFSNDGTLSAPGSIHMNGDGRYFQVSVTSDTGSGANLQVLVYVNLAGTVSISSISNGGQYYNVGDVLFIDGSLIGGHEIANQINIEVIGTGTGGVIEGTGQLTITSGIGPRSGVEFNNFAAVQTDDNANGNLVFQSFNTNTEEFYYSTFDNTGNLSVPGEIHLINDNAHGGAGYAGMITFENTTSGATNTKKFVRMNSTGNLEIINNGYSTTLLSLSDSGNLSIYGNANVGNLGTTTAIITTGNITTVNTGLVQNGNSNVTITANANITLTATSNATMVITGTGANVTGYANISGNVSAGNVSGAITLATLALKMPVYADATARDAAITSPTAGMIIYNTGSGNVQVYSGSAWGNITVS
jgi:hypothetical protein